MRRTDREVSVDAAWEIADRCTYGVVAMTEADGTPYAVPVNLAREGNCFYFHSAQVGKKAECLRRRSAVCVTFVEDAPAIDQPGMTTRYASAILFGRAEEVTEEPDKIHGLSVLCRKLAPENPRSYGDFKECREKTALWRITVDSLTGKSNHKRKEPHDETAAN